MARSSLRSLTSLSVFALAAGLAGCGGDPNPLASTPGDAPTDPTNPTGDELLTFVLDPSGPSPVTLHARSRFVEETESSVTIRGAFSIESPAGDLELTEADVTLTEDPVLGGGLQHVAGTARLPLPTFGLAGNEDEATTAATLGFDTGESLAALAGDTDPLKRDRRYLSFTFRGDFDGSFGSVSLASPAPQNGSAEDQVLALDPNDPVLFTRATLAGGLGESDALGVALSFQKRFTLASTRAGAAPLEGHLWLDGELDLAALDLSMVAKGVSLFDLDSDGDDVSFLDDARSPVAFVSNGALTVGIDAGGVLFELPLRAATLEGTAANGVAEASYSGSLRAKSPAWPAGMSVTNPGALAVAGTSGAGGDSLTLSGRVLVSGVDLTNDAVIELDGAGVSVSGKLAASSGLVPMTGTLAPSAVALHGSTSVRIPISADRVVERTVTDAKVCGSEMVTDEALCGTVSVYDAVECGTETVTDASLCGATVRRDLDACGAETVTDGNLCGTHVVTDAGVCGTRYVEDQLACGCGWFGCGCQVPLTCTVASTCTVAAACPVPNSCETAKMCNVPATCEHAKTCVVRETEPDANLGTFRGTAELTIDENGLGGSVSGEYCAGGGAACKETKGRVKVDDEGVPRACVSIGTYGEFCKAL